MFIIWGSFVFLQNEKPSCNLDLLNIISVTVWTLGYMIGILLLTVLWLFIGNWKTPLPCKPPELQWDSKFASASMLLEGINIYHDLWFLPLLWPPVTPPTLPLFCFPTATSHLPPIIHLPPARGDSLVGVGIPAGFPNSILTWTLLECLLWLALVALQQWAPLWKPCCY